VACYACADRVVIEQRAQLYVRDAPTRKVKPRVRCSRCGFYPSAPIHKLKLMKGNPVAHDYVPSVAEGK